MDASLENICLHLKRRHLEQIVCLFILKWGIHYLVLLKVSHDNFKLREIKLSYKFKTLLIDGLISYPDAY